MSKKNFLRAVSMASEGSKQTVAGCGVSEGGENRPVFLDVCWRTRQVVGDWDVQGARGSCPKAGGRRTDPRATLPGERQACGSEPFPAAELPW